MSYSPTKDSNWLYEHKKIVTSQFGEDGIIEKIFEIVETKNKWCVEFGADNGVTLSNTWNLIINKGWHGIAMERNPVPFPVMQFIYKDHPVVCLNENVECEGSNKLDSILQRYAIPKDFDFISIDVDSYDYQIWKSFVEYTPSVVCIEFCQTFKYEEEFIYGQDKIHAGSSLASIVNLGRRKGYELVCVIGVNAFFVLSHLYPLFEIWSNDVANYNEYILEGDGEPMQ